MKKFFAAALVVSMLTVLLSGCMCQVADTTFQFDGSGTVEAKFGFSEEMVNAMNMRAEMTQNGFSYFRYNGHSYYGDQASESFANADEFNAIFAEVSAEIAEVSKAATPGTVTLSVASDGGLTLTVQNTQTDRRAAIKKALAAELPNYSDAQINALLEDMVMTYRFAFPAALVDYNAAAGITVEENFRDADTQLDAPPAYVILTEGMTSDVLGESDVARLKPMQDDYNRMVSDDQDALRFNMFPQTVFTDATENCLGSVKISPGAMIDLQTDPSQQGKQAQVSKLETHFSYDSEQRRHAAGQYVYAHELSAGNCRIPQGGGRERQGHASHVLGSAMPVRGALGGMGPGAGVAGAGDCPAGEGARPG